MRIKTLEDGKESGFFLDYHRKVSSSMSEEQWSKFSELTSNVERVRFVAGLAAAQALPGEVCSAVNTSESECLRLKEEGNKSFQVADYHKATWLYSQSILQCNEKDAATQCVLLANRSASLYHLEKHALALADIAEALSIGAYPRDLHYKVLDRRARCYLATHQQLSARDTFRATLSALDDARLPAPRRAKWQQDVQVMLSMLEKGAPGGKLTNVPITDTPVPKVSGGRNTQYPSASRSVKVEMGDSDEGRLVRAAHVVAPGDVIVVESPHVVALLAERRHTHCWHCLNRTIVSYSCGRCCDVAFCSATCRRAALNSHHRTECRFLPVLWDSGASITCLLALRMISQAGLKKLKALMPKLQKSQGLPNVSKGAYRSEDFLCAYQLVSHEERRDPRDLFHRALMAYFLLRGLQSGNFFEKGDSGSELTEDEAYVGGLLLHSLQVAQFNSHEVAELTSTEIADEGNSTTEASLFVGGGIYPTLALFNHSCDPGVVRYFLSGSTVVACAIRGVAEGQEICENYGPIYTREPRDVRQSKMREQYWFDCACEPCSQYWPQFDSLPDMQQGAFRMRCSTCGAGIRVSENDQQLAVSCMVCGKNSSVMAALAGLADTERKFKQASGWAENGETTNALTKFLEILAALEKFLAPPPTKDYVLCQQAARRCMLALGNTARIKSVNVK